MFSSHVNNSKEKYTFVKKLIPNLSRKYTACNKKKKRSSLVPLYFQPFGLAYCSEMSSIRYQDKLPWFHLAAVSYNTEFPESSPPTLELTVCAKHTETVKHTDSLSNHRGEVWWVSKSSTALWSTAARIYQVCYISTVRAAALLRWMSSYTHN